MKLGELVVQHQDRIFMSTISRGIQEATLPWKLHRPVFYNEYDIVEGEDVVLVECRYGQNLDHIYYHRMPIPREIIGASPEEVAAVFINSFREGFRSWRIEPEDNIILGEE